jgi:hypothetical protein
MTRVPEPRPHDEPRAHPGDRRRLGDDVRWLAPWDVYRHPEGQPIFDMRRPGASQREGGLFAGCESVEAMASAATASA